MKSNSKEENYGHNKDLKTQENLSNAFDLARPLWFIYSALAGQYLINACGASNIMAYQHGKIITSLREFIKNSVAHRN